MKHVTGSGGLFFQAKEPEKLCGWYRKDLGIEIDERAATFRWQRLDDPQRKGTRFGRCFRTIQITSRRASSLS